MNLSRLRRGLKSQPIFAKLPKITNSYIIKLKSYISSNSLSGSQHLTTKYTIYDTGAKTELFIAIIYK